MRELADQVVEDIRRRAVPSSASTQGAYAPFDTTTRIRKLAEPTYDPAVVADTALALLAALADERPIRLLGVRAEMTPPPS